MKKIALIFTLSMGLFSYSTFAHNLQLNSVLPAVSVANDGELVLSNNEIKYQPWSSEQLRGKVRIVNHFAGRTEAKEKNLALIEAIKSAKFDTNKYQTTTIVNADDAVIATGMFVKSSAEKGKKANAHSQVVLDQKSAVKNAWQLKEKDNAVIVLDKNGKVQWVSEGKLSSQSVQEIITLVGQLLSK